MARSFSARFQAALVALLTAFVPQAGGADLVSSDLAKLRSTLRTIETTVTDGVTAPVDVSGLWAQLALEEGAVTATPAPKAALSPFGATFLGSDNAPAAASAPAQPPAQSGLFALQLAQASRMTPSRPVEASKPEPAFGGLNVFGAPATPSATPSPATAPQDVDLTNFRVMLATLSQTYTGLNAMAVVYAQGPRGPQAVSVRAGTVTLDDIRAYSAALGMAPLPDGTLTAPVVIWPGATLRLGAGDRMALSRDSGAFVISMGRLEIDRATIEVVGGDNVHTPSFVPFVTVAGEGSLSITGATLRGLGFGHTAKFSGLSVARNLLTQRQGDKGEANQIVIRDSLFDGLKSLSVSGVSGAEISGNTFINARDATLILANAPETRIENNLFTGGSHTNAIRVEKGSGRSLIERNIFLLGHRVAMLVAGGSDRVRLQHNLVWKRDGAGIKFLNTKCGLAAANVVLDNRQKGVEVRKSDGTHVYGNLIAGNGSAGIWVSAQHGQARTSLDDNVLVANGSGLSTATSAEILMQGNNFARQMPRLLDGDIARLSRMIITDLRGDVTLRVKDGSVEKGGQLADLCGSRL